MVKTTYKLGLIGYPLGHSLSPQIHAAALHELGLNGEYTLYPISPRPSPPAHLPMGEGGRTFHLSALLKKMQDGQIHGLNVTIPHKQNVIPLLDRLTPAAKIIGAVNTIFVDGKYLIGDNTDAPGFWADLQKWKMGSGKWENKNALVLGAGGSARAVVYALLIHGFAVTIAARRVEQAEELGNRLSVVSNQLTAKCLSDCSRFTDQGALIVNTTPVGMFPHPNASPWPTDMPFPKNAAIYDLVYNPKETALVKNARAAGLAATNGLGMLIEQAALAFERWTGLEAPRAVMRKSVEGTF